MNLTLDDLISPRYRSCMQELHVQRPDFGIACRRWARVIFEYMIANNLDRVLDYGAGKGRLGEVLGRLSLGRIRVINYEPAVRSWSHLPAAERFVVCIDVLEHVEPDYVERVVAHLASRVIDMAFMTIAHGPAVKRLPDGRNAHLIQKDAMWWRDLLSRHLRIVSWRSDQMTSAVMVKAQASREDLAV